MLKRPKFRKSDKTSKDLEQLGQMLTNIYETGYINRNQAYKMSFLKGLAAGFGGVIGGTIVVALVIWMLSLFDSTPVVGPMIDNLRDTVKNGQQK